MNAEPHPLAPLRAEIDAIDEAMVRLLARRAEVVTRVAQVKAREGFPALIPERVEEVVAHARNTAASAGLDPALAETVWRAMIGWFVDWEARELKG